MCMNYLNSLQFYMCLINNYVISHKFLTLKLKFCRLAYRAYCFVMQEYLLNCWEETPCVVPISIEEIVAVSWLHSSGMVFICLQLLHITYQWCL